MSSHSGLDRIEQHGILCLCLVFQLESKLRLLEPSHPSLLHVIFGEEQRRANASSASSNATEDERPSEPIVSVAGHPLVAIAKDREDYHAETRQYSSCEEKISGDLKKIELVSSQKIKEFTRLYHEKEMLLIGSTA